MSNVTLIVTPLRPLSEIARETLADPTLKGNARAWSQPYLQALLSCNTKFDQYFEDTAESCVLYALSNLQGWRGDNARRIKAELNSHIK